ncbi:CCDC90 family protein [Acidiferrobacter sp.]
MLDTYTLIKRLTQAGVPEAQAEAHMSVFLDMSERGFATKGDIENLGRRMGGLATDEALSGVKRDVTTLKQDVVVLQKDVTGLKQDVAGLKQDVAGLKRDVAALQKEMAEFRAEFEVRMSAMAASIAGLETRLMVRLGGLIVVLMSAGFGVLEFTLAH